MNRLLDIAIAALTLVFVAPLMILVALVIFVTDPGPVLFRHARVGHGGRSFHCLKFRTMVIDADRRLAELLARDPAARAEWALDHKLRDDPRITWLGNFLRKSSIDELPQLVNVLLGQMSIVGPRPIVAGEIPRYGRYIVEYLSVRPGITGLWQVSGRNDVSYRRRVAMDVVYVRRKSLVLDMAILGLTFPCVLAAKGSR